MKEISFKSKIKVMGSLSFIGSTFLILSIIGLIFNLKWLTIFSILIYLGCKIIANITWRCPKCKSKLPKGQYTHNIKACSYCNYNLNRLS
ncbi:TPA: hypothetical protein KSK08_003503 [Clostridioides difficile]|nr:hypothetical protein [Clostridioides difficile]